MRRARLALSLAVIAVTLAACGSATQTATVVRMVPVTAQEPYPTPIQEAFTQACQALGADREACACAVNQVEAKVPDSHFDEYEEQLAQSRPSARFLSLLRHIIASCATGQAGPQLEREVRELERDVREATKAGE